MSNKLILKRDTNIKNKQQILLKAGIADSGDYFNRIRNFSVCLSSDSI